MGECLEQQSAGDGRVHAAGYEQESVAGPYLLADALSDLVEVGLHAPLPRGCADADHEILQNAHASLAVAHLGMELQPPGAAGPVAERRGDAAVRIGEHLEARSRRFDRVAVAHPCGDFGRKAGEQLIVRATGRRRGDAHGLASVLAFAKPRDLASEVQGHPLDAVADAEDGEPRIINRGVGPGRIRLVGAPRRARQDDALRARQRARPERGIARKDLGVDAQLSDAPAYELGILASVIQDQDRIHGLSLTIVALRSDPTETIETVVSVYSSMKAM